jgi:hypothetical protein
MNINFLKEIIPPILLKAYNNFYSFTGSFSSWEEAVKKSTGFDSPSIVEKVKKSLLKVKNGEAVYERDSVLFDKIEYSWPLLASLMWISSQAYRLWRFSGKFIFSKQKIFEFFKEN